MASPLHTIRKNQKIILGVLGILLMIVFVFGDVAAWMDGGPAGRNEVVVRTNYGDIREREMEAMLQRRAMVNRFVDEAMGAAFGAMAPRQAPPTERDVVLTMVLAKKGEDLGMVVSDNVVNDWIRQRTADRVTTSELRSVMQNARISQRKLFDALAEVILANQVAELSLGELYSAPPAARWDYFQRLRRQVRAEVLPVPVEQFVSQIKTPGENELKVFFEQHRDQYAVPGSAEPGFKVPPQGQFEFFRADYQTFYDAALATVTPEDIEQHYETNKDARYLYRELPDFGPGSAGATPPAAGGATPPTEVEQSQPATQPEQTTPDSSPKSAAPTEPPAASTTPQKPEPDESNTPADSPSPESSCGDAAQEGAGEAVNESQPPAQESSQTAPPAAISPPLVKPLSEEYLLPRDIAAGPNPKYQPLWRVEEDIRKELARTRATEQIKEVFDELRQQLDAAAYSWSQRRFSDEKAAKTSPGPQVDFAKLAAGRPGMTVGKTRLAPATVIAETTELGKSRVNGQAEFASAAFERLATFKPATSEDADGNQYLFWKIDESEAKVPELAAVRKEVEHAWKMIKARDLALARAQELAAEARRDPGKSLRESLGAQGKDVVETNTFSWLTLGSSPMMMGRPEPRLSEVQGVEYAGHDFMRTVYNLDANEVGVAMNHPRTVAYVVRLVEGAPDEFLRTQFMAAVAGNYQSFAFASEIDAQPVVEAWRKSVEEEAGIEWVREPDEIAQR